MLTIVRLQISFLITPWTTSVRAFLLGFIDHRGAHDASRNGDDCVTENHHHTRKELAHRSDGGDVAIAHSGERDDSPIDARWDVGERGVGKVAFNHVHHCADDCHEDEHKEKIYGYLPKAHPDTLHQQVAFVDEGEELEHAEDAYETESAENEEVACACKERDERKVERHSGKQVNDAEEAEHVVAWTRRTVDAKDVLDGEEECEHVLQHFKH